MTGIVATSARWSYAIKISTRYHQRDKLKGAVSSVIGSEVLRGLSEYDGRAAQKWGAAPDTLPQAARCIMSLSVRAASPWRKSGDSDC
ncbi:MAG: hypothetical protein KGZ68_06850 [Dechloromonas sp.]|nr:hypothetical protein [Dechloromonas sp.]